MTDNPLGRLRFTVGLACFMLIVGIAGFHILADLDFLDATYMAAITLTTVGYREVGGEPTGPTKVFIILYILTSVGVLFYTATVAIEVAVDDRTRYYFRRRSNTRKARKMNQHYIVCGLGRVGRAVAEELSRGKESFVVVDRDPGRIAYATSRDWTCISGDASEDAILQQVNIGAAKGLFACVETDAINLFIVVSARGMNPILEISARVVDELNLEKFRRAGASHVYSPYSLLGRRMARSITRPRTTELLDLALEQTNYDLTIDECRIPERSRVDGNSLVDADFRGRTGCVVLAIIRSSGEIYHNPAPTSKMNIGDVLVVLGTPAQLDKARLELAPGRPDGGG